LINNLCATGSERLQPFFSAGEALLLQEVADGKINVQSGHGVGTVFSTLPTVIRCRLKHTDTKTTFQ
jgi:hypothetical protein